MYYNLQGLGNFVSKEENITIFIWSVMKKIRYINHNSGKNARIPSSKYFFTRNLYFKSLIWWLGLYIDDKI